jgi:acyl-CoA synthetase (NDP forming)
LNQERLKEFEPVFYPRSIAVVGVSRKVKRGGTAFLEGFLKAGFKGKLYAVSPAGGEVLGLKIYPNLRSIPEPVDYALLSIPRSAILDTIDDCAAKGVKAAHLFTAGFSETGDEEARDLEREMVRRARMGGVRLIGPNCIGVYSPRNLMPYGPMEHLLREAGSVAFVSQSGGQGENILIEGMRRGLKVGKGVSFGNGADLDSPDFLEYLAVDPETEVIGAYLEGVKDGRRLFRALREAARAKPVVMWKGGRTGAGARTATSHTGSLAGSDIIWDTLLKQTGAAKAESFEELFDTLLAFQNLPRLNHSDIALIGGLFDGAGGWSVAASDTCVAQGLSVPPFSDETRRQLEAIIPPVGTILRNPIDTGGAFIRVPLSDMEIPRRLFEVIVAELDTNIVLLIEPVGMARGYIASMEVLHALNELVIDFHRRKPFVIVSPPGLAEAERMDVERRFADAGLPVYPTVERAAKAMANVARYWKFRDEIEESDEGTGAA